MANFKEELRNIKAFVFDVDGVFTDGQIYLDPSGEFVRSVNMKDGYAVAYALKQGYIIGIISGENQKLCVSVFSTLVLQIFIWVQEIKKTILRIFILSMA